MISRSAEKILPLLLLPLLFCSRNPTRIEPSPWIDGLRRTESNLKNFRPRYRDDSRFPAFRPDGLLSLGNSVLVFSSRQPRQIFLTRNLSGWQKGHGRMGPLKTSDCRKASEGILCLGEREPGGIRLFPGFGIGKSRADGRSLAIPTGLEDVDRGYSALSPVQGRKYSFAVATTARPAVVLLEGKSLRVGRRCEMPWRVLSLVGMEFQSKPLLLVALANQPRLQILDLSATNPCRARHSYSRAAPIRKMTASPDGRSLLLLSARDTILTRPGGAMTEMNSFFYQVGMEKLIRQPKGAPLPADRSVDLGVFGLTDASDLLVWGDKVFITGAGSSQLAELSLSDRRRTPVVSRTCFGPQAMARGGDDLLIACRFDNAVEIRYRSGFIEQISLSGEKSSPELTGEWLFHNRSIATDTPVSCQSCHWNGLVDWRMNTGGSGERGQIRPAFGVARHHPFFSSGHFNELAMVTEEFFLAMNRRYWQKPWQSVDRYWGDIRFSRGRGEQSLSGEEARQALLRFLVKVPGEPPLVTEEDRRGGRRMRKWSRGKTLFDRHCATCHQGKIRSNDSQVLPAREWEKALHEGPLAWAASGHAETGITPHYVNHGNRISPLLALGRGGPFFTDGSAADLHAVLRHFDGRHAQKHRRKSAKFFSETDIRQLEYFLLSL